MFVCCVLRWLVVGLGLLVVRLGSWCGVRLGRCVGVDRVARGPCGRASGCACVGKFLSMRCSLCHLRVIALVIILVIGLGWFWGFLIAGIQFFEWLVWLAGMAGVL